MTPAEPAAAPLRAGVARVELPCGPGQAMMGYGARRGGARGQHDPLWARALYLEAAGSLEATGRALVVECDLCLLGVAQARAARERIARATGLRVDEILLGCTHTHSGPDSGLAAVLAGADPVAEQRALLDAAVAAGVAAVRDASPARLGAAAARASIGRNRRRADAVLDPGVEVLRVDDARGRPRCVLFVYGCHATVLGHENLDYSADWPGAAVREIEAALPGALALFVLGAHGDVDPRTRGMLDLAIEGQSRGQGFDVMESLGREVGRAVVAALRGMETGARGCVAARSTVVSLEVVGGVGEDRVGRLADLRARAVEAVGLPGDAPVRTAELFRRERRGVEGLSRHDVRERVARVREYVRDRSAPRVAGGERVDVEVQALRLGPLDLLGLPLEVTADVGLAWKAGAGRAHASVASIANGWLRYLPAAHHFTEPDAHHQYEVLNATLEPAAAERLLEAGETLVRELDAAPDGPAPRRGVLPVISH